MPSSYVRRDSHAKSRNINGHVYQFLRSYRVRRDAVAESARWNSEPGISAKVTGSDGTQWTVRVSEKRRWRR